jgi:glycerol-3-phosphate dehydrogenase subunit C
MERVPPEKAARAVLDACADCDVCRFLMDTSCLFFPELYRLYDREFESGEKATSLELRALVDLCNFCGQCPCPNIRAGIIEAKTQFIERDGLHFGVRTIEDVERIATLCGAFPKLTNALFQAKTTGGLLKAAMGIHQSRKMPVFPNETFPDWVKKNELDAKKAPIFPKTFRISWEGLRRTSRFLCESALGNMGRGLWNLFQQPFIKAS